MRTLSVLVLFGGCVGMLRANTVLCTVSAGSGPLGNTPCGQTFVSTDVLNWGAPVSSGGLGEAINPAASDLGSSVNVTSAGGVQIGVTTNLTLERADDTEYAWDGSAWVSPTAANGFPNINTFTGQFNAPSFDTTTAPYGPNNYPYQFGDNLLGAVAGQVAGPGPGPLIGPGGPFGPSQAELTFSFNQLLYGVAFELSSATNQNFIATLNAYDSSGDLLGQYQVDTNGTGAGGNCASLGNIPPVPCNDAPVIQFYDADGHIASVVLVVNDSSGLFVDGLSLNVSAPEPETAPLIGGGLIVLALLAKRVSRARQGKNSLRI